MTGVQTCALPILGLATLSAMVVFFSSVVLVPIGVAAWGTAGCLALLWTGWLIGGIVTYTVGRTLGRRFVERIVPPEKLAEYERRIPAGRSFWTALVIQMALQSDVAGYLFGIIGFPAPTYLAALITSELIVALGTVFAGEAFLSGRWTVLLGLAAIAAGGMLWRRRRAARP